MPTEAPERAREDRLRRQARQQGRSIRKSRVRNPHLDDQGGYMLLDHESTSSNRGIVVAGARFELSLEDVEELLAS